MSEKKTILFHGGQSSSTPSQPRRQTPRAPFAAPAAGPPPAAPPWQGAPPQGAPQPGYAPGGFGPGGPPPQGAPAHARGPGGPPPQGAPPAQPRGPSGAAPGWGNIARHAGGGGGPSKLKVIGAVAGSLLLAALVFGGYHLKDKFLGKRTSKGAISYRALGLDLDAAPADQVIGALEAEARRRWKRDASWWSVNLMRVRPDGTLDMSQSNGALQFVSASGVQALAKSRRKDSIKEYSLSPTGARSTKMIGAKDPWKGFEPLPVPGCKIADLVKVLGARGFADGTVRITFDPKFGFASGWNWRVWSKDDALSGYYSMDDCAFSKSPPK